MVSTFQSYIDYKSQFSQENTELKACRKIQMNPSTPLSRHSLPLMTLMSTSSGPWASILNIYVFLKATCCGNKTTLRMGCISSSLVSWEPHTGLLSTYNMSRNQWCRGLFLVNYRLCRLFLGMPLLLRNVMWRCGSWAPRISSVLRWRNLGWRCVSFGLFSKVCSLSSFSLFRGLTMVSCKIRLRHPTFGVGVTTIA